MLNRGSSFTYAVFVILDSCTIWYFQIIILTGNKSEQIKEILESASPGELEKIKASLFVVIKEGKDYAYGVSFPNSFGNLLFLAMLKGQQLENMDILLHHGIHACVGSGQGKNVLCATLYATLRMNNTEVLQKLLQYKVNPNCQHFNPVHTYSHLHRTYGTMIDRFTCNSQHIKPHYVLPLMALITTTDYSKGVPKYFDDKLVLLLNYGGHLESPLGISGTLSVCLIYMPRNMFMLLLGSGLLAGPGLENLLCGFVNNNLLNMSAKLHFILEHLVLSGERKPTDSTKYAKTNTLAERFRRRDHELNSFRQIGSRWARRHQALDNLVDEIHSYIGQTSRHISLKDLCRISIREKLFSVHQRGSILPYIFQLPLPPTLKRYISFEMLQYYHEPEYLIQLQE